MKRCPFCAEEIQEAAKVCRYCDRDLEPEIDLVSPIEIEIPARNRAAPPASSAGIPLPILGCFFVVALSILVVVVSILNSRGDRSWTPATASERSAEFEKLVSQGKDEDALRVGRELARLFPDSAEAKKAASRIERLETDARAKREVRCDRFEVSAKMVGSELEISLETDLPATTSLMVRVSRSYEAAGENGTGTYSINYFEKGLTVGELPKSIMVDVSHNRLETLKTLELASLKRAGIKHRIKKLHEEVEVSFVVPVNQSDGRFGRSNENLTGKMVTSEKSWRGVRAEKLISYSP